MKKATIQNKEISDALRKELRPLLLALRESVEEGTAAAKAHGLSIVIDGKRENVGILKGEDGKTPVRGVDYWTKSDIATIVREATPKRDSYFTEADRKAMLKAATPIKGVHYTDGERGRPGHSPVVGKDFFTEKQIAAFLKAATPKKGIDYKDGAPGAAAPKMSAEDIRTKLESLTGTGRLKAKAIHGLDVMIKSIVASTAAPVYGGMGGDSGQGLSFPSQTGNAGKYLTTDGSSVSWATVASGGGSWGTITGTLSSQTDLQNALNAKASAASVSSLAASISTAGYSGAYADLTGKPTIPTTTDGLTQGTTNLYSQWANVSSGIRYLTGTTTVGDGAFVGSDATHGLRFGYYNSNWFGLWPLGITPTTSNYALISRQDGTSTQYNSTDNISFNISDVSKLYINSAGGVGIGNTAPLSGTKLDVSGAIRATTKVYVGSTLTSPSIGADVGFVMEGDHSNGHVLTMSADGHRGITLDNSGTYPTIHSDYYSGTDPKLHLSTYTDKNNANGIFIQNGGSVGIGTATPGSTLDVNGGVNSASGYSLAGNALRLADLLATTTLSSGTSITPNIGVADGNVMVCTATAGTFTVNAPTGTPKDMQPFLMRIKFTNAQTYAFNAIYRGSADLALPTGSAGGSTTDYLAFRYNATDTKYDYVGKIFGF